jgi:hypothetical protein
VSEVFVEGMSVSKRAGVSISVWLLVWVRWDVWQLVWLGGVELGAAGLGGMWLGGRGRRFDSHQLNCAFYFSFLFLFGLSFLVCSYFTCHIFILSKGIRYEQCEFHQEDVS